MWFDGRDVAALGEKQQRAVRPQIQLVFQDPANSLNSRLTALEIVAEPLIIQRRFDKQTRSKRACALLERVGIPAKKAGSRPDEFSGREKPNAAICPAFVLLPPHLLF